MLLILLITIQNYVSKANEAIVEAHDKLVKDNIRLLLNNEWGSLKQEPLTGMTTLSLKITSLS
jgi:hypothetical protein